MAIDNNLAAKFYRHPMPIDPNINDGKPFKDTVYIKIRSRGMKDNHSRPMRETDKDDFPNAWARFLDEDSPLDGTPLKYLPGINEVIVKEMSLLEIHTIEDMAGLQEAALVSVPRGRKWQRVAAAYLAASEEAASIEDDEPEITESVVDTAQLMNDPDVVQLESKPKKKRARKKTK